MTLSERVSSARLLGAVEVAKEGRSLSKRKAFFFSAYVSLMLVSPKTFFSFRGRLLPSEG